MLLFVTANKATSTITTPPAGWTLEGTRLSSTDTETYLYSRVAAANDAGRNAAVTFSATTKSTITLLAYDGTAADPVARVRLGRRDRQPGDAHTTPGANVATAGSYVVSYWADKSGQHDHRLDPPGRPDPAQHRARHRRRPHHLRRLRHQRARRAPAHRRPHRDQRRLERQGDDVDRRAPGRPDRRTRTSRRWRRSPSTARPRPAPSTHRAPATPRPAPSRPTPGTSATARTGTGVTTTHTYTTSGAKTITLDRHRQPGPRVRPGDPHRQPGRGDGGGGNQPVPGHTRLVPDKPRDNTPRISNGEIWDIEVVPQLNRVFIAGSFTSLANTVAPTTTINQANLASYNLTTGLDRHAVPPDLQRRRVRGRGQPRRHQAVRRRLVQHRQRRGQAEGRQPQPDHRCAADHLRLHQQHQQPGAVARGQPTRTLYVGGRFTRVNGAAPHRPRRGQRRVRCGRHDLRQPARPAASASTASSASRS